VLQLRIHMMGSAGPIQLFVHKNSWESTWWDRQAIFSCFCYSWESTWWDRQAHFSCLCCSWDPTWWDCLMPNLFLIVGLEQDETNWVAVEKTVLESTTIPMCSVLLVSQFLIW
jgi:hypothetical protein